jgi:hypothetical protein
VGFKQTNEELDVNKAKVDKSFLPAKLGDRAWVGLLPSMGRWLLINCTVNGLTDGSVANMIRAVNALDGTGLFDWEIAPIKKPSKKQPDFQQTNEGRRVTAREAQDREHDILMTQERARRSALGDAANAEIMAEAAAIVSRHSANSHSRTAREKAVLKTEFDRLVASRAHPKQVLESIKAKQNTFANGDDVTQPSWKQVK